MFSCECLGFAPIGGGGAGGGRCGAARWKRKGG
uniref:Bzip1 n=1 Tax=Arundo donax TaxID=35708 RepID=A0A0A9C4G9_ARUDO